MADFQNERQAMVEACQQLVEQGYFAATGGNLAVRAGDGHLLVTPSALEYRLIEPADIAVLRFADGVQVGGRQPPTVERQLHLRLLRARPDKRVSLHTHQPAASAVAVLHERLAWRQGVAGAIYGRHVGLVPYWPSGTSFLAKALARHLEPEVHCYLLASHGVICAAPDLPTALHLVAEIEASASAYLYRLIECNPHCEAALKRQVLERLAIRPREATLHE